MTLKVIGAGFGRNGTLSLKLALEQLGFGKCYHMMECQPEHLNFWTEAQNGNVGDWNEVFEGFQSSVDWPSCNVWREQLAAFPDAKVVLSVRDSEAWYKSVMNTIYPHSMAARDSDDETVSRFGNWAYNLIWKGVFDGRMEDKAHAIEVYERHNQSVQDELPPEKLLVYQVGSGWEPLCAFLGVDVPETDYPKVNTTEDFNQGGK